MTDSISRLCQAVPRISLTFGVEQADVRRLDRFHANQTMSVPSSKWERHTSQHTKTAKQRRGADRHMGFRRQMLCHCRPQCRERFAKGLAGTLTLLALPDRYDPVTNKPFEEQPLAEPSCCFENQG